MKRTYLSRAIAASTLLVLPTQALAHHAEWMHERPFLRGLSMPLHGIDHILVAIAVGLMAVELGGQALWAVPAVFSLFMLAAGMLNVFGYAVPGVEQAILASILILGVLLARERRLPLWLGLGAVGLFAAVQGSALINAPVPNDPGWWLGRFAAGCLVSSAVILASGLGLGFALRRLREKTAVRYAGVAIVVAGILVYSFPAANDVIIRFLEGTR